jgi:hypothetical protein
MVFTSTTVRLRPGKPSDVAGCTKPAPSSMTEYQSPPMPTAPIAVRYATAISNPTTAGGSPNTDSCNRRRCRSRCDVAGDWWSTRPSSPPPLRRR